MSLTLIPNYFQSAADNCDVGSRTGRGTAVFCEGKARGTSVEMALIAAAKRVGHFHASED